MQVGHSQSAVQVGQSIVTYTKVQVPLQTRDTDWLFVRHHMISAWGMSCGEKNKKKRRK